MSWLHKIQDGWMVAELLDPAAWHCWLTDFSVQAVPFSWERTETANSTAPSFANKWSLIVTEAAMAAGRGRGWCWHEAGLEDGRMTIFLSRPWGCWGCMALTLVTFLCFWWGPANPICQSQCSILAAYFVFNQEELFYRQFSFVHISFSETFGVYIPVNQTSLFILPYVKYIRIANVVMLLIDTH